MPAMFGLVWLALPLCDATRSRSRRGGRRRPRAAVVLSALDAPVAANFAKFGGDHLLGWLFLKAFEQLSWVVIVALAIPWVDAYSVWRGPTKSITEHHAAVFTKLSIAFVVPGGNAARLGLPDVLFFAVFLGASHAVRAAYVPDLAPHDRRPRRHDRADDLLEHRRAAGAAPRLRSAS